MSDTATRLRTFLLADATIASLVGNAVHQSHVPQRGDRPWIWFRRSSRQPSELLDSNEVVAETFDVECVATSLSTAQAIADAVWALDRHKGTFGDSTTPGVFVNDQSDDYLSNSVGDDEGYEVCALLVQVFK